MKVTLCGSTKFMDLYHEANLKLTLAGHLVYSVATSVKGDWTPTMEEKCRLDIVHLQKIDASGCILVISDESRYVGESTLREVFYARVRNKKVYHLQEESDRHSLIEGWELE